MNKKKQLQGFVENSDCCWDKRPPEMFCRHHKSLTERALKDVQTFRSKTRMTSCEFGLLSIIETACLIQFLSSTTIMIYVSHMIHLQLLINKSTVSSRGVDMFGEVLILNTSEFG